ncbi:MAG: GTP cyclohydrolase II [Rhodospirillales bacterium]|nr:GTP cyclohydrolase II [Rhodospirillales bacterium]
MIESIEMPARALLPSDYGDFNLHVFQLDAGGPEHLALVLGDLSSEADTLVRVHSECITGDVFMSLRCDCRSQLEDALEKIRERGRGVLIYLRQEGRGIGLTAKIKAYALQEKGLSTIEANEALGFPADCRTYDAAAVILRRLGVSTIELITNNPHKVDSLRSLGIPVVGVVPSNFRLTTFNARYLRTKQTEFRHEIRLPTAIEPSSKVLSGSLGLKPPAGVRSGPTGRATHVDETPHGVLMATPVGSVIGEVQTSLGQNLRILTSDCLDWIMTLNGQLQNCSLDVVFYHEMMAHVPMITHGAARRLLVVGGASGALVGELLKYRDATIDVVEIDRDVSALCERTLPTLAANFGSERVSRHFKDIRDYFLEVNAPYDVIFFDIPDLNQPGPAGELAAGPLIQAAFHMLQDGGLLVCQTSVPFFGHDHILFDFLDAASRISASYGTFGTLSPLFPGGFQTFVWLSKAHMSACLALEELRKRHQTAGIATQFYSPETHLGSVAIAEQLVRMARADNAPRVSYATNF